MKKSKTPQPSIKKTKKAKYVPSNTNPNNIYSWRDKPISEAFVNKLIQETYEYPKAFPNAKTITPLYRSKGLSHKVYYSLVDKYPKLKEAHEATMRDIGERLWGSAVDNKANWAATSFRLYKYAPEFKEETIFHASLKAEQQKQVGPQVVVIERYPDAALPDKKETKEPIK